MTGNPIDDQMRAASEDAARRLRALAKDGSHAVGRAGELGRSVVERWFDADRLMHCPHLSGNPEVVFSAASFPGIMCCGECFSQMYEAYVLMHRLTGRGRPCDACGERVSAGYQGVLSVGPILMTISWCPLCAARDEASVSN
jgi:hypothetical protein